MRDANLIGDVRSAASADDAPEERAKRAADLIRNSTGYRWVGIYRVTESEIRNLGWSGPAAPAYPNFPIDRGLTGAAIESRASVVANDVAHDARYLTNQDSTGSELIVPVVVDETIVGTLDVEDAQTDAFQDRDIAFFESVAAALAGLYV
jgi:L-methionine (R)-S-oxide reductase